MPGAKLDNFTLPEQQMDDVDIFIYNQKIW